MLGRRIISDTVAGILFDLFISHGAPEYVRSDNSFEFTVKTIRKWLTNTGSVTLFIEPGSPLGNGYIESLNGKMPDELLNGEIFNTLLEAQMTVGQWVNHCNNIRPHSALSQRPPASEVLVLAGASAGTQGLSPCGLVQRVGAGHRVHIGFHNGGRPQSAPPFAHPTGDTP